MKFKPIKIKKLSYIFYNYNYSHNYNYKYIYKFIIIIVLFSNIIPSYIYSFTNSAYKNNLPQFPNNMLENFLKPINFSRSGIVFFIENVFNKFEYSQDFLPYRFDHFIELVYMSHRTPDPKAYFKEITKLWREKYKEVFFADAQAVAIFLEELPKAANNAFTVCSYEMLESNIKKCVIDHLTKENHLKLLTGKNKNHEKYLENFSKEIMEIINNAEISNCLVDFLESVLNKTLWSYSDKDIIFEIFESLDQHIYNLYINNMIDEEGFYRLSNALICRLKYHIEIAGGEMNNIFYLKALKSIEDGRLHLLVLEEIEDSIKTRSELLKEILLKGQLYNQIQQKCGIINF